MSFKLLAIRPLKGCNEKFLKNLDEARIYKFYNDYKFYNYDDKEFIDISLDEVYKIKYEPINAVPENLFNQNGNKINISAIVGKNGSGKSSLVELLYAAFYNISVKSGLIKDVIIDEKKNEKIEKKKEYLKDIINDLTNDLNYSLSYEKKTDKEDFLIFYQSLLEKRDTEKKMTLQRI